MKMKTQSENKTPTYMRLSVKITILLIFFLILTYDVLSWWTVLMDEWIYNRIMNSFSPNFTPIFIAFTNIWGTYWIPIVALILTAIFADVFLVLS